MPERSRLAAWLVGLALAVAAAAVVVGPGAPRFVTGRVDRPDGRPAAGAVVRIQAGDVSAVTDGHGRFRLPLPSPGAEVAVTAWAAGSYIVGGVVRPAGEPALLTLAPLPDGDDPSYRWLPYDAGGPVPAGAVSPSGCIPPLSDQEGPPCRGVLGDAETGEPRYAFVCSQAAGETITPSGMAPLDCTALPLEPGSEDPLPGVRCRFSMLSRMFPPPVECRLLTGEDGEGVPVPVLVSPFDPAAAAAVAPLDEGAACAGCHSRAAAGTDVDLPVDHWLADAHAFSPSNPRFRTMYLGTDLDGNTSPPTRFVENRDYGMVPLPPDPSLPYYGPGYRLDFPASFGNCAACHAPMAAIDDPYGIDPTAVSGTAAEGIGCDFCHKVSGVVLDPATGLPSPNMPGVLSMEFRRPPDGHQYFAGPYDDVAPGEDTYVPVYTESAYCAPCHHGVFWDVVVYDSYGEWLASPYADPATGQTCQDCHMPPTGATIFASPSAGGLERDPATIAGHVMAGADDPALLRNAVTMTAEAAVAGGELVVEVTIVNDATGHHMPTDSPLRHLILVVDAAGPDGTLPLTEGPVVPSWGGVGDPAEGRYAGLPGTAYAKVLEEVWTGVSPSGAYWNPTRVASDNRIPAMGTDTTTYRFALPGGGPAAVEVTLVYRRAFAALADQKGWGLEDTVMATAVIEVP